MKRLLDLAVAIALLTGLSPLMMLAAVLVRWKMGAPILFKQLRPGLRGKLFYIYKFRTMKNGPPIVGNFLTDRDRLTSLGSWMRRASLDELPQLFNVLRGELSLVGPRPLLMEYLPRYSPEQARRHNVKPGITGWAQVNGRNAISWEEKFKYDVWYVDNRSFGLDVKILWLTLLKVLKREGINQAEQVTMEVFMGNLEKPVTEGKMERE
ncbi:MAG: sugar transferase [Firmicutes bacterium]|nr:sugar transferase [Bacillota bacterium]